MLTDPMASEVIYSFLLQVVLAGALGLMASHFWLHQRQENGLHATVTDPCEDLIEKAKLSERFKLGTKTPYQFEAAVTDDSFMHGCPAVQVSCCHPNELVRAPVFVSPLMYTMVADVEDEDIGQKGKGKWMVCSQVITTSSFRSLPGIESEPLGARCL